VAEELYYLDHARFPEQRAKMEELEAAGICMFCPQHLTAPDEQPVLQELEHWIITPNRFPYLDTELHLLLVPREHVTDMADLSEAAQLGFFQTLAWIRQKYELRHYGLAIRNGDCARTGGTIRHLHAHLVVGQAGGEPVKFKLTS
jgi:ATP adenylyltransferase